jgi:hypothetical protein
MTDQKSFTGMFGGRTAPRACQRKTAEIDGPLKVRLSIGLPDFTSSSK